jgi:hypothetical protein
VLNFQKIQHIGMNLGTKGAVKDLTALLLWDGRGGEKMHETGLLCEAGLEYLQLAEDPESQTFVPGKLIQSLSINVGCVCHNTSPKFLRKSSISFC